MVTLVKGKVAGNVADREQVRPAVASQRMATGAAARQEPGLAGWFKTLILALDATMAGPAMTDRERTRRQIAQFRAEKEHRLSQYY